MASGIQYCIKGHCIGLDVFGFLRSFKEVHPLLPMVALFFFLMTVGCLLGACLADPGIIPRREVAKMDGSLGIQHQPRKA